MMQIRCTLLAGLLVTTTAAVSTQAPLAKAGVVSVAGCLREQAPGEWRLVNATDPQSFVGAALVLSAVALTPPTFRPAERPGRTR